jgi:type I restriction enzyme, S subunit
MLEHQWPEVRVRDVCAGIFDGPHATPKKTSSGPIFLGISNLANGRIDRAEIAHVSEADFIRWTRRVTPQKNDIVFSYETRLGEAALVPGDIRCCLGRRMALMRPDTRKVDPRFLLYYFLSNRFQEVIRTRTIHGSTVDRIPLIAFPDFPISLPSLAEQKTVAQILGTLDDKIELNRRMNETLEAIAQALFKSWFVDFDPVRVLSGQMPEKPPFLVKQRLRQFGFPSRLQDSQLGEIPVEWRVAELGQITDVIDCLHSKKPERVSSGLPLLQLNNIRDDGLIDMTDTYLVSETDYAKWISRMEASEGDCVITNVGRVGAVAQIPSGLKAALGRNMTGVRCRPESPFPAFLIECLLSASMREEILRKVDTGTILDALNVKSIPYLRFILPAFDPLNRFEEICRPIRQKMEENLKEACALASLRDALLPKLLSGELRLKETEEFVAPAKSAGIQSRRRIHAAF